MGLGIPAVQVLRATSKRALAGLAAATNVIHSLKHKLASGWHWDTSAGPQGSIRPGYHSADVAHFLQERLLPLFFYQPFCRLLLSPQEVDHTLFNNLLPPLPSPLDYKLHKPKATFCLSVPNTGLALSKCLWNK